MYFVYEIALGQVK